MKKILLLSLLTLVGYYWILAFRFCHPYPKTEFFTVIGIQFGISFIPYLFNSGWGRIITIISGLTMVRLGPILGIQSQLITLMGVFLGGVFGNLILNFIQYYRSKKSELNFENNSMSLELFNSNLLLILFLVILTLDRFLIYFNAPYFNGFGILETMFVPGVSSKEAFALSMESICNLLFPLLFFYAEQISNSDKEKIIKDFRAGVLIGLFIQFIILFLQIYWNENLFAENTNLSLEAHRVMGLFRDSGSSTWIIPILCFFCYEDILENKKLIYSSLLGLILIQLLIAPYQGRGFWLIFFFGLLALGFMLLKKNAIKLTLKNYLSVFFVIFVVLIILYQIPKAPNSSLDRLLSIPFKIISILQNSASSMSEIDPHRYYFNLAAWNLFLQEPLFGNGIGSHILNLKDTKLKIYTPENKIDNPSFYFGVISEIGIMGVIILILYTLNRFQIKKNILLALFLLPAFSIGYHIVHPDGAFVILLIWTIWFGLELGKSKWTLVFNLVIFFILLLFFGNTISQVLRQEKFPEFRKENIHSYQLSAYEWNKEKYHVFKGKVIWRLGKLKKIDLKVFLDNSTSKQTLKQKWTFLDKNRQSIREFEITVTKEIQNSIQIEKPKDSYYLQVEELNESGKTQFYGDVPFCIPSKTFSKMNRIF